MSPLSTSKPAILVFSRSPNQPAFIEPMNQGLRSATGIDYRFITSSDGLVTLVEGSSRVVLLVNCLMKEDIADLYNLLPEFTARVAEGTLKILVLNSIGHPRLGLLLKSRAAIEIIEIPTTLRAVQYKLKHSIAAVHQAYQKAASVRMKVEFESDIDPTLGTKTRAARTRAKASDYGVLWQPAVDFVSDYWWIPTRKSIRNVVGVWLIDVLGPGPVMGTWEEVSGIGRGGEKAWAWRPRAIAEDLFQTVDGRWIFFGKQPEFSWQKNLWSFVSKQPMFAFYAEEGNAPIYLKMEYRPDEGLRILENSSYTQGLLDRIQATFESRLGGRSVVPDIQRPKEAAGNFDGWDFNVEPSGSGARRMDSDVGEAGEVDWNDHTGARGIDFKAKDIEVDRKKNTKKIRSALKPDEEIAGKLGLVSIETAGIAAGGDAFERLQVNVEVLRRNGNRVDSSPTILLYEVNEAGSVLLIRDPDYRISDRLILRFSLDSGEVKVECSMEWELTSVDLDLEDGMLVTGVFRGGEFDPLFTLLDRLEARKKELKDFYSTARG